MKIESRDPASAASETSSGEESPSKIPPRKELERSTLDRHVFLFQHNLRPSIPDLRPFCPLESQIPFLVDVYAENVNCVVRILQIPTMTKIVRNMCNNDRTTPTPANHQSNMR